MFEIIGRLNPQSKRTKNLRFSILNLHRQLDIQIGKPRIVLMGAMIRKIKQYIVFLLYSINLF